MNDAKQKVMTMAEQFTLAFKSFENESGYLLNVLHLYIVRILKLSLAFNTLYSDEQYTVALSMSRSIIEQYAILKTYLVPINKADISQTADAILEDIREQIRQDGIIFDALREIDPTSAATYRQSINNRLIMIGDQQDYQNRPFQESRRTLL